MHDEQSLYTISVRNGQKEIYVLALPISLAEKFSRAFPVLTQREVMHDEQSLYTISVRNGHLTGPLWFLELISDLRTCDVFDTINHVVVAGAARTCTPHMVKRILAENRWEVLESAWMLGGASALRPFVDAALKAKYGERTVVMRPADSRIPRRP